MRLIVIGCVLLGIYFLYREHADSQNYRLRQIVEDKYEALQLPTDGRFVYEEISANRNCKDVTLTKVFASDASVMSICKAIVAPITLPEGSYRHECTSIQREPSGAMPAYEVAGFGATLGENPYQFSLSIGVSPQEVRPSFPTISFFRANEVGAIAEKYGKYVYSISIRYTESRQLFDSICPDGVAECECMRSTLYSYKFVDGRQHHESN